VDASVRVAAAAATSVLGSDDDRAALGELIDALTRRALASDRRLAADMLAASARGPWLDSGLLGVLLADDDPSVRAAALHAFHWDDDHELGAVLIEVLGRRSTSTVAVSVLAAGGARALRLVEGCLDDALASGARRQILCARVCHAMADPDAGALLRRHVRHRDRDVALAMVHALAERHTGPVDADDAELASQLVSEHLQHAARLLQAIVALDGARGSAPLQAALTDELQLARRHVLAGLSLVHGTEALGRVEFQLAQSDTRVHALALEWLDVTLTGTDRRAIVLLDPAATTPDKAKALGRAFTLAAVEPPALVRDLAEDHNGVWRQPWLSACAIMALADGPDLGADLDLLDLSSHDGATGEIVRQTMSGVAVRRELGRHG